MAGFLAASALDAPSAVAWGVLVGVGGVGLTVRDEWRRRQDA
ncbi:hypothetical protein [Halorussus sp. AFM4]